MSVVPSSCAMVKGSGEVTETLPINIQIVGSIELVGILSTRLSSVKALDPSQVPTFAPVALKSTPVVVNVTSALAVVQAPAPLRHVASARLAAVAPVALFTMASVVDQP